MPEYDHASYKKAEDPRFHNDYLYPPPRYPPTHNGYHSDNDVYNGPIPTGISRSRRVPSPPPVMRRGVSADRLLVPEEPVHSSRRVTTERQRPSPPPTFRQRGAAEDKLPYRNLDFYSHRVPSPPPRRRTPNVDHGGDYFEQKPRRYSFDYRSHPYIPQTSTQKVDAQYLGPSHGDGEGYNGLKRSRSERTPKGGSVSPPPLVATTPINSPDLSSSVVASSPYQSEVLGDKGYQYKGIRGAQFRLVKIFPERKTLIRCQILHASLNEPPRYVAISYAWGDAGHTRRIELEGSLIHVSVSLHGALNALREKNEFILVWVDALCIDQQNRHERSQQVQLMTSIYSKAAYVTIWLGSEEDDSDLAATSLRAIADRANSPEKVSRLISSRTGQLDLAPVVSLFERDYWRRLWVVQEIYNAKSIIVYCGSTKLPWKTYQVASRTFARHRSDLDHAFPGSWRDSRRNPISADQLSAPQILVYQGPASLPDIGSYVGLGGKALLAVLRACRRKITSDAKDKLFGILGVLPEEIRKDFPVDYGLSVKEVYTEIVDYLINTTERVDVICDAIHFPIHTGSANLPSFVPDWSHIPQTTALGHTYDYSAGGVTKTRCRFLDERLNKLEMSAIYLDTISIHGIAVGTICTVGDYLMAFLQWRALLLGSLEADKETSEYSLMVQEDFCKTMSLGQVPSKYSKGQWLTTTYHVFASLLRLRLPLLPLDPELRKYIDAKVNIKPEEYREFLQKHIGDRMMGRSFCRTKEGRIGMGAGLMLPGDIVVVPLGCSTPILLRLEGSKGEYRFVGDIYINGYMYGRAVEQWKDGKRDLRKYVLH